jgi:hypothetical protein
LGKGKLTKNNPKGVTLSQDEKLTLLPSLREQSRMNYLEKREKDRLEQVAVKLKDEKELFDDNSLTLKELKMRQLK